MTFNKNKGMKRTRFGGETAWKQHRWEEKNLSAAAKARRDELAAQSAIDELSVVDDADDTGFTPLGSETTLRSGFASAVPYDGCLEADGVILVYRGGKLSAALCG